METKQAHNRSYEDFDPVFEWRTEEGRDTVELLLPGFKREQIRIQINHLGFLVISGERRLLDGTWKRFKKEFELPKYCNEDAIRGNYMENILSVVMPKRLTLIPQQEQQMPELEEDDDEEEEEYLEQSRNVDFRGTTTWELENTTPHENMAKEAKYFSDDGDSYIPRENQFVKNDVERTREVALKFMVVVIVVMVIVNYLVDLSKSVMAQAQSYFQN